jgi:hypothetical protein
MQVRIAGNLCSRWHELAQKTWLFLLAAVPQLDLQSKKYDLPSLAMLRRARSQHLRIDASFA